MTFNSGGEWRRPKLFTTPAVGREVNTYFVSICDGSLVPFKSTHRSKFETDGASDLRQSASSSKKASYRHFDSASGANRKQVRPRLTGAVKRVTTDPKCVPTSPMFVDIA